MIAELLDRLRGIGRAPRPKSFDEDLHRRFAALWPNLSPSEIQSLQRSFLTRLNPSLHHLVPGHLLVILQQFVQGMSPKIICDPCAGVGAVIAAVQETVANAKAYALTRNQSDQFAGKILAPLAEWRLGDPLESLRGLPGEIDLAVGVLPFGVAETRTVDFRSKNGTSLRIRADLNGLILLSTLERLAPDGCAFFVVQSSFLWSERSVRTHLAELSGGLSAVFALPPGIFAPYTQIGASLIVVSPKPVERLFIGQLSRDEKANARLVANFSSSVDTGTLELGRFVPASSFRGFEGVRLEDMLESAIKSFGAAPRHLGDFALHIHRRQSRSTSAFAVIEKAVFIPLIGNSVVVTAEGDRTLKPHNYAQVIVNPDVSDARFVAHFLNSEVGRQIREFKKTGTTIPQLNNDAIRTLPIFVPDLKTQSAMLALQARITAERTAVLGLQNELSDMERELWRDAGGIESTEKRLKRFASRLSSATREDLAQKLEEWSETLPFPLASILRAWRATESEDHKARYEHLLYFFEATAELLGIIFLSAFKSNEALYESHKPKITETLQKVHLSFEKATFGTWRVVLEYFGKQTRQLLSGDGESRLLCAELFSDASLALPNALSRTELLPVLSAANKMRNDWTGHGGVVSQDEAKLRNEVLKGEVQRLRESMTDFWTEVHLIRALHCKPRTNGFETEVAVLMSSNSEFLKDKRLLSSFLLVDHLYLANVAATRALKLLPLIALGPGPQSAKNACYFFNRLDKTSARFVSYHFLDQPEMNGEFSVLAETIRSLTTQNVSPTSQP